MMSFKRIFKVFICVGVLVVLGLPAKAQENKPTPSITLSPSKFDLAVEQKEDYKLVITVTNNSEIALPISVEVADYAVDEMGSPDYTKDESLWSAREWIKTEPDSFILESEEKRDIKINVSVPETAEPGSHFVVILFKPVLPEDYFEDASTHVIGYIGAIAAFNVNSLQTSPLKNSVSVLSFTSNVGDSSEIRNFNIDFENSDVFHHQVTGVVTISNAFNKEIDKIELGDVTLFPKIKRIFTSDYSNKLFPGYYTASLQIKGENDEITSTDKFVVLPGPIAIISTIVGVALLVAILKYRKNFEKALKVIFTKD